MQIVEETDTVLRLESRPWLTGLAIVAVIVLALGIGLSALASGAVAGGVGVMALAAGLGGLALHLFARLEEVRLSRPDNIVQMRTVTLAGRTLQQWPLDAVAGAGVETIRHRSSPGSPDTPTHRVVLRLRDGTSAPLTASHVSGPAPRAAAAAINRWLRAAPAGNGTERAQG